MAIQRGIYRFVYSLANLLTILQFGLHSTLAYVGHCMYTAINVSLLYSIQTDSTHTIAPTVFPSYLV